MPPRLSWKAHLRLSLVSVPVQAFNAADPGKCEIHLHQLHAACHSRIRYQKVCPIHGQVKNNEIVSGYEYAKDQYVVIDPDELDKLRTESDKAIALETFIGPETIDPLYLDGRMYYLLPDGPPARKPYAVLQRAMEAKGRWAIGQIVLSGKEQLLLVRPMDGVLVAAMLNPRRCMRQPEVFDERPQSADVGREELKLAETLIDASTAEEFDWSKYEDRYTERLRTLIEAKVQGKELVAPPTSEEPQVINLMDALRQSVARAKPKKRRGGPPRRKVS